MEGKELEATRRDDLKRQTFTDKPDKPMERLIRKIFEIIPSYYDEREAAEIAKAVRCYLRYTKKSDNRA